MCNVVTMAPEIFFNMESTRKALIALVIKAAALISLVLRLHALFILWITSCSNSPQDAGFHLQFSLGKTNAVAHLSCMVSIFDEQGSQKLA